MNRALRAATMGVLLLTPVALTACSSGQVNQTSSQDRDKVGPRAEIGALEIRQVVIVHPCEAGGEDVTAYEDGDNPELTLTVVNGSREDDTLTGIEGDLFDGVYVGEAPSATSTTPGTTTQGATPGTTTGGAAATPTAVDRLRVDVPAGGTVTIGLREYPDGDPCEPEIAADTERLFLADLDLGDAEALTPAQVVPVTLTFADAGSVQVNAFVAGPAAELPREEGFDFHEEEGADEGNEQDTEAE